jgi:hypothetical protein
MKANIAVSEFSFNTQEFSSVRLPMQDMTQPEIYFGQTLVMDDETIGARDRVVG